ncbi:MAG: SDR family oxidoreductase [Gemmatimonadetes bacterium]|nr:SDR family oxidoreductase [Gemmatimonadota bacterium]MBT7859011.1 SDR family oxidoreductase [Gemmatimonadota bacterium]
MSHPLFDLSGRVALVSGAAQGVGRAMSLAFAEVGADLLLADLNEEGARQTATEIEAMGRRAIVARCDVSDPEQIRAMFGTLDQEFGRIDVLANVAGGGVALGPPEETDLDAVGASMQSLVIGRFCACQEAGRRMLAAGKGSIINIVSIAGLTALGRGHTPYSMAMGGVAQMTRELSTEWASRGVRVNSIVLAQVMNPDLRKRIETDPRMEQQWLRGIATGRLGEPEDVKGVAIFLASDASSWVTGVQLPLDGGNLAMNAGASYPGGPGITG